MSQQDEKCLDYVKYDEKSISTQELLKQQSLILLKCVNDNVKCPRSKALVKTKIEEAYMWMGKGVRNDQIERSQAPLQEERTNS